MPVGPIYTADGVTPSTPRYDRFTGQVISQAHGKYYEATSRGFLYSGCASGLTPTTGLATASPLTLYNPVGSGKRLAIKKVSMGPGATGTLGSGAQFHCVYTINGPVATQSNVAPTGTAVSPVNCDIGAASSSVASLLSTATLNANPLKLYPFAQQGQAIGGTTAAYAQVVTEDVDGNIILEPGSGWTLQGVTASGTSPVVSIGVVWEEIPIG